MIKIYADNTLIWETGTTDETLAINSPRLVDELGKVPTLSFEVPNTNVAFGQIVPLQSRIKVVENGEIIFYGRPVSSEKTFKLTEKIVCENGLGFLRDFGRYSSSNINNPVPVQVSPVFDLYAYVLDWYTTDSGDDTIMLTRGVEETRAAARLYGKDGWRSYLSMFWDLAETYPATIWLTWEESGNDILTYLHYAETSQLMRTDIVYPADVKPQDQTIQFGYTLLDLDENVDLTGVYTVLKVIDSDNSVYYTYQDADHVSEYGTIYGSTEISGINRRWSDAAGGRTTEAKRYYDETAYPYIERTVKAIDLVDLGANRNRFQVGFFNRVYSPPHGVDARMQCRRIERQLDRPGHSVYEFGQVKRTLTDRLVR